MAGKRQMDDKKKEDRALALLALAGDRSGPPGPCPAEGELARLVEGRVSAEERNRLQHHLSLCHDCYSQWLALSQAAGRPTERGLVRPGRFRRAGYIGTALALAASVALFFNIYHESQLAPVGPAGRLQLREKKEAAPAATAPQPSAVDAARPSAPGPSPKLEKAAKEPVPGRSAAPEKRVNPAAPPPPAVKEQSDGLGGMARQQDKKANVELNGPSAPAELAAAKNKAAPTRAGDEANRWLDRVREGCRAGRLDRDFWLALQAEGAALQQKLQSQEIKDVRPKIAAVLSLLEPLTDSQTEPDRLARQCRLLQEELDKDVPIGEEEKPPSGRPEGGR